MTEAGSQAASALRPHAALISTAEAAALSEARRRFGPGGYEVTGRTNKACCVHLSVTLDGQLQARWRYELDGRVVDDPHPPQELAAR